MFTELLDISIVALAAPLVVRLAPRLRIPAIAIEIIGGIILGPQVLGFVKADVHVQLMAQIGLAFLLFLAGLEVDLDRLRGPLTALAAEAFALSVGLAVVAGYAFRGLGGDEDPLFVAVILVATSLGVLVPVLKDTGEIDTEFGQLVFIAGSMAEFGSILLLSLFFSKNASSPASGALLLAGFGVVIALGSLFVGRAWHTRWLRREMERLDETSSPLRLRAAIVVMFAFVAMANHLGLEAILGSFVAGALIRVVDRDDVIASAHVRAKLEAIGFGFVVPFFFVATGLTLNMRALFSSWSAAREIVEFLVALLVVRGVPAALYRHRFGARRAYVAGLMQATSLTFVVVATELGAQLHKIDELTKAAFITGGLISVVVFPALALVLFGRQAQPVAVPELEQELRG
ncbi:MAG: cation:proton antiporter [Acidimicrobiia bacterium]|nr:cation:proton antiporter [Acidimicrobiia bacterium]